MAAQGRPLVEELEQEIDSILERKPFRIPKKGGWRRPLAITEQNVRRVFGLSLWELFRTLADRFGYELEDESPPRPR